VNAIQKTFQNLPKPRFYLDESRIRTKELAEAPGEVRLWRIRILPGVPEKQKKIWLVDHALFLWEPAFGELGHYIADLLYLWNFSRWQIFMIKR
jgi:hypothetical protein